MNITCKICKIALNKLNLTECQMELVAFSPTNLLAYPMKTRLSLLLLCSTLFANFAGAKTTWQITVNEMPRKFVANDDFVKLTKFVTILLRRIDTTDGVDFESIYFPVTKVDQVFIKDREANEMLKRGMAFLAKYKIAETTKDPDGPQDFTATYIIDRLLFSGFKVTAYSSRTFEGETPMDGTENHYFLSDF